MASTRTAPSKRTASKRTASAAQTTAKRAAPATKTASKRAAPSAPAAASAPSASAVAAPQRTYLELSEDGGGAHKFYEVTVKGASVTIRYGRIGDSGQTQEQKLKNAQEAASFAQKKISEKQKKGYAPAVIGERQKRPVTRRQMLSKPSTAKRAPVLWRFESGSPALGIFIDKSLCWVGNQGGAVYAVTHEGEVMVRFKLPDGVKCIIADEAWRYAGCDDGNVYDLSGRIPRLAYEIEQGVDIFWLDIYQSALCVSDNAGGVSVFDHESETSWKKKSKGGSGWMVRADEGGVYHGHSGGVTKYGWRDGSEKWHRDTPGGVMFGWQEADCVYAGTTDDKLCVIGKDGEKGPVFACDDTVWSCAASPGGKYAFAGDSSSSIYCFSKDGSRLWKLATGCGSAYSMQYLDEKLYIVTTEGTLACIDASEAAIAAAQEGNVPKARDIKAPPVKEVPTTELETTSDAKEGVLVECYKEGGKLRVRVLSPGYKKTYNCQFPRNIREEGARYVVDKVLEAKKGGFYRALGDIRKLTN
jgi:predicted DNA-binding WGR domain protein